MVYYPIGDALYPNLYPR